MDSFCFFIAKQLSSKRVRELGIGWDWRRGSLLLVRAEYQAVLSHMIGHMVGGSATAVAPGQVPDEAPWLTTVPWLSGVMPVWNNSHGWSRFQMKGFRTQNWGSHSLISVYGGMIGVYLNGVEVRGDRQWAEFFPMASMLSCVLWFDVLDSHSPALYYNPCCHVFCCLLKIKSFIFHFWLFVPTEKKGISSAL